MFSVSEHTDSLSIAVMIRTSVVDFCTYSLNITKFANYFVEDKFHWLNSKSKRSYSSVWHSFTLLSKTLFWICSSSSAYYSSDSTLYDWLSLPMSYNRIPMNSFLLSRFNKYYLCCGALIRITFLIPAFALFSAKKFVMSSMLLKMFDLSFTSDDSY